MIDKKNEFLGARRAVLKSLALSAAGIAAAPALAQPAQNGHGHMATGAHKRRPMHGVLGAPGAGEGRPRIAMLIHPKLVMQDLIGPMTVFNLMHSEMHLVWKNYEPVPTDLGISLNPTTTFEECPEDLDILFVPGGLGGSIAYMDDSEVIDFLADAGLRAKYVTSVCTGALLLGAAGLLDGYKATTHWYVQEQLSLFGATPVSDRVVVDRNRITGGGVTAGIDFGLMLASKIRDQSTAERIQLVMEYAPNPPFNAGLPETAPPEVYNSLLMARTPVINQSLEKAERIGAALKKS